MKAALKTGVEKGTLVQVKSSYRLSPDARAAMKKGTKAAPKKTTAAKKKSAPKKTTAAKKTVKKSTAKKTTAKKTAKKTTTVRSSLFLVLYY